MSDFSEDVDVGFYGNSDTNQIKIRHQEEDKALKMAQLVDEITALHKNENPENQEQEELISMAPENSEERPIKKFQFKSETQAEKEEQEKSNKLLKLGVILTLCLLLLSSVLAVIVMYRTSEVSSSHSAGISESPSKSISSCSDAMEILPSPCSSKQTIYLHGNGKQNRESVEVLCDFEVDGGGWTIIQKRSSGPKGEFNRVWTEYKTGFGSLDKNFWLGLKNIHALTKNGDQELRIDLEDFEGNKTYAKYSNFSISDNADFYRLSLSGFFGNSTAGDSMINLELDSGWRLNGMQFTTRDQDNDQNGDGNCGGYYNGGWWFNSCGAESFLNGLYRNQTEKFPGWDGIHWKTWTAGNSLAKTEMKIRTRKQP